MYNQLTSEPAVTTSHFRKEFVWYHVEMVDKECGCGYNQGYRPGVQGVQPKLPPCCFLLPHIRLHDPETSHLVTFSHTLIHYPIPRKQIKRWYQIYRSQANKCNSNLLSNILQLLWQRRTIPLSGLRPQRSRCRGWDLRSPAVGVDTSQVPLSGLRPHSLWFAASIHFRSGLIPVYRLTSKVSTRL